MNFEKTLNEMGLGWETYFFATDIGILIEETIKEKYTEDTKMLIFKKRCATAVFSEQAFIFVDDWSKLPTKIKRSFEEKGLPLGYIESMTIRYNPKRTNFQIYCNRKSINMKEMMEYAIKDHSSLPKLTKEMRMKLMFPTGNHLWFAEWFKEAVYRAFGEALQEMEDDLEVRQWILQLREAFEQKIEETTKRLFTEKVS